MISMKRENQNDDNENTVEDKSEYPYGLTLHLDSESLDKLGMSDLPKVGTEMEIGAKVKVESVSMSDSEDGKDKHVTLQVTDMDVGGTERTAADTLYGGMNE